MLINCVDTIKGIFNTLLTLLWQQNMQVFADKQKSLKSKSTYALTESCGGGG